MFLDQPCARAQFSPGSRSSSVSAYFQSFTGLQSRRYPAPDVARGFMLLLIAVANVPVWMTLFPGASDGSVADQWWILIRQLVVDHRAYPLFSLLFGFGLMTMVQRRHDAHVAARTRALDESAPGMAPETKESWIAGFEHEALDSSRALLRRRGWWMLLFGALHALFFPGDIIGTYALVALLCAGLIAGRRWRLMILIALIQQALAIAFFVCAEFVSAPFANFDMSATTHVDTSPMVGPGAWFFYPLMSLIAWVPSTIFTVLLSQVLPAVFIGAALATTDIVSAPERHRTLLLVTGVGGLSLTALLGAPSALAAAGFVESVPSGMGALHEYSGLVGALGWLALLTLFAGPAREHLGVCRDFLAAIGRRSMSAYVFQSFAFIAVFASLTFAGFEGVTPLVGLGIAVTVWTVIALACWVMERGGRARGPLEVLLRRAVAASARAELLPALPVIPARPHLPEGESSLASSLSSCVHSEGVPLYSTGTREGEHRPAAPPLSDENQGEDS